jgi:hypothetical protein
VIDYYFAVAYAQVWEFAAETAHKDCKATDSAIGEFG